MLSASLVRAPWGSKTAVTGTRFQMFVDANGVPFSDYGTYRGIDIGRQRSILSVAERGLWYWNRFFSSGRPSVLLSYDWDHRWPANKDYQPTDAPRAQAMLLKCADWLLDNVAARDGFSVWVYPYPFSYGTKPGWRSAHAQAVGLQLLTRAAALTGEDGYLAPAPSLLAAFGVDVQDGGLSTRTDGGRIWFEKMADEGNAQPKVLNGMLFAILGLHDVGATFPQALWFASQGIDAAVELLPAFDLGNWSAYDALGRPASKHYHVVHISQLAALSLLYARPIFQSFRNRFARYLDHGG
jgi:hypothetical protein